MRPPTTSGAHRVQNAKTQINWIDSELKKDDLSPALRQAGEDLRRRWIEKLSRELSN